MNVISDAHIGYSIVTKKTPQLLIEHDKLGIYKKKNNFYIIFIYHSADHNILLHVLGTVKIKKFDKKNAAFILEVELLFAI